MNPDIELGGRYASVGAAAVAVAPQRGLHPAPHPDPAPDRHPDRRADHLRVVEPAERARRTLTPARAVVLSAVLFALLLAVAVAHTLLVQGQVRLDHLDSQLTTEQLRYQQLRRDVAQLESPTRVVEAAHAQGMVTPDDLVYLQPRADASAVASGPSATPSADRAWTEVKPMLEAPAP